jgi:UDP-glucose 4-epimerase
MGSFNDVIGVRRRMRFQRILVTGGAGFIGSHTVDALLQQDHEVVVLDNLSSGRLTNLDRAHPKLTFVEGDVLDFPLIEKLLEGCDAVLHLAAITSVPQSLEVPIHSFQVNTQGLLHVLEAVRKADRPIRIVYASSAAVYGEAKQLPCNDAPMLQNRLLSPYAVQKKHDEDYANLYGRLFGLKTLGLRYFNVYGPRQDPKSPYSGVISRFLDAYVNHQPLTVFGGGKQSRDFIFVNDVVHANLLALSSDYKGALNIATGKAQTLLDLIKYIEQAGGYHTEIHFEPARAGDIFESYATTVLAKTIINFQAKVTLEEGIARMMGEYARGAKPVID